MSKTNYADSKKSTLAILEILKRETSENKTLTIQEIMKLVKECYDIEISRNTVTATLHSLADFYGEEVICCSHIERGKSDYTTSYYYNDNIICSDSERKVKLVRAAINEDINQEKGGNYEAENWVSFGLYGFGYDGKKNLIKNHKVFPIEILENDGEYYLVSTYEKANGKLYHFRFDLMDDIKVSNCKAKFDKGMRDKLRAMVNNLYDYKKKHAKMYSGDVKAFTLEAKYNGKKDNGFTYLHDLFGDWMVLKDGETSSIVVVQSTEAIMEILLEQYKSLITLVKNNKK